MTAEPIEMMTTLVAAVALLLSIRLSWQAARLAHLAVESGRRPAVQELAWSRLRNEALRAVIVALVLIAGMVSVMSPPPVGGSPARPWLQATWLVIAVAHMAMSLINEATVRRVIRLIDEEPHA